MKVPDLSTHIVAFRYWWVTPSRSARIDFESEARERDALHSRVRWPKREKLVAVCQIVTPSVDDVVTSYNAPCDQEMNNHHCGIYAYKQLFEVGEQFGMSERDFRYKVFGEVALWGKVVVHRLGYRAQYAYPLRLFCNGNISALKAAEAYGIPLVPMVQEKGTAMSWDDVVECLRDDNPTMRKLGSRMIKKMEAHVRKCGYCRVPEF